MNVWLSTPAAPVGERGRRRRPGQRRFKPEPLRHRRRWTRRFRSGRHRRRDGLFCRKACGAVTRFCVACGRRAGMRHVAVPVRIIGWAMTFDHAEDRIRGEYTEMPGMRLTVAQVQRLCGLSPDTCL